MNPITAFLVALCLAAAAAAGLWVSPYLAGVFVLAAVVIAQALQLRAMNIIYETTKERDATILLLYCPVPWSTASIRRRPPWHWPLPARACRTRTPA
jgi:hypothetical protein